MKIGAACFLDDKTATPSELAVAVEERGLDGVFFPEHSHIPVSRETRYPDLYGGGKLPDFYKSMLDPFIACAAAMSVTTQIDIGTAVTLLPLRDTVHTAKEVASIDVLSGGRFIFGVGFGWNRDEFLAHRVDFATRHRKVGDQIAALKKLWSSDVAEHDGEFVTLPPSWAWPKPAQAPHPPIFFGGNGPRTMRAVARHADGWMPTLRVEDPAMTSAISRFADVLAEHDRRIDDVPVIASGLFESADQLKRLAENGISYTIFFVPAEDRSEMLRTMDTLAEAKASAA